MDSRQYVYKRPVPAFTEQLWGVIRPGTLFLYELL